MAKEMLINVSEGEECRIALVEDGVLEELYMERTSSTSHVGNVYKGKVMNVEPSIQAAFVDFGLGRNGFLHISDLLPSYFGHKGDDVQEFVGKKMARRDRPPIQRCLRRGDEIVVQVIKEGIGTKGPTLSAYLSISGKMLVMMPGVNGRGVSRKIEDEDERRRLKQILVSLDPPEDCGFIIRTESVGKSKVEIERDLKYLSRLWDQIKRKRDSGPGAMELYTEGDLVTRTVRDVFSGDVDHIVIDNKDVARRVKEVIKLSNPRAKNKVDLYEEPIPLFHKYGIEREIEEMYSRHVPLRSGGSLVIDSTEAIVAIDVNSGKNRENSDAEMTAFRTDMEAADEICRQLKLRDLGGVIIVDFIDLRYERHRRDLEQRLHDNLKNDRAKTKVLRMSQFGIIEMTRQRMRPSLKRSVYFDCPHCKGAGLVKTPESMSLDVMRRLAIAIHDPKVARVELAVNPDVAFYLQNKKRQALANLEYDTRKRILIKSDAALGLDEMRHVFFDNRDGVITIEELAGVAQAVPHKTQLNTRPQAIPPRGGRQGGRRDERGGNGQRPPQHANRHREDEPEDFDRDVEDLENRSDEFDRDSEEAGSAAPRGREGTGANQSDYDERDEGDENFDSREESGEERAPVRTGEAPRTGSNNHSNNNDDRNGEGGGRKRRRRRRRGRGRGGPQGDRPGQPQRADGPREAFDADRRPVAESGADRGEQGEDFENDREGALSERDSTGGDREAARFDERDSSVREERDEREEDLIRGERDVIDREDRGDREDRFEREREPDREPDREEVVGEETSERSPRKFDREERPARPESIEEIDAIVDEDEVDLEEEVANRGSFELGAADWEAPPRDRTAPAPEAEERQEAAVEPEPFAEAPTAEAEEEAAAPKRAKRTHRGGRGRGKKKPPAETAEPADAAIDEGAESGATAEKASAPKGKSRRRPPARGAKARVKADAAAPASATQTPAPSTTAVSAAPIVIDAPVVRTGSSDRHLADEEPVLHEPVRRPRSHRDLDHIPEDYE